MKKKTTCKVNTEKGIKKSIGVDLGLIYTKIEIRWDQMCKFVDQAKEYGVDSMVAYDMNVIKRIREQQRPLPTVYQVSTHKGIDDQKVKLTFNKRDVLFELEKYTDFNVHQSHENLQVKFFFDEAFLTKVSYQKTREEFHPGFKTFTDRDKKVIDLQQKQIDPADATEMTK